VTANPAAADLYLDRESPSTRVARILWVVPGEHVVLVEAPGHQPGEVRVSARRGSTATASIALATIAVPVPEPKPVPVAAPPAPAPVTAHPPPRMSPRRIGARVSMGTGAALVVAGAVSVGLGFGGADAAVHAGDGVRDAGARRQARPPRAARPSAIPPGFQDIRSSFRIP